MKLHFTPRARQDLATIADYIVTIQHPAQEREFENA